VGHTIRADFSFKVKESVYTIVRMIRSTFSIPAMTIAQRGVHATITQTLDSLVLNDKQGLNRECVLRRLVGIKLAFVYNYIRKINANLAS